MKRTSIAFGHSLLAVSGLVGVFTLSAPVPTGADMISPGVTIGSRFDQQRTTPRTAGDWTHSLTPQLLLERLGPYTTVDLRAESRFDKVPQSSSLQRSHDIVLATIANQWAEHTRINIEGSYYGSRDFFNPDPNAQISATTQQHANASATLDSWRAGADYSVEMSNYQDASLDDGLSQSWGAALFPFRTESTRWLIGGRHEEFKVADHVDLTTTVGTVGIRRQHTPLLSTRLEIGAVRIDDTLEPAARNDLAFIAGIRGIGLTLGLPFDARAEIRRDVTTAGVAEIWRDIPGLRLALRYERSLHATGGFFNEPTDQDFVTFEAQDTLGGRTIVSLEGSYRRARPRSLQEAGLETYRAAAAVSKDLQPWLRVRARYSLAQQNASASIAAYHFDRNRVELMLTAVYQ